MSGTVAGYNIVPAKPGQYVVTTTATGLTAGENYEGVIAFNIAGTAIANGTAMPHTSRVRKNAKVTTI